ncbi:MAG: 2-hydroxyglutaryl-CoA dehydratase [Firmicutes bacterium]|nr:2-hydroxyglutaryl-CoA dehydratase [Bacillota bacterium]
MNLYLGIDAGSVSTNVALLDDDLNVLGSLYIRTRGRPIDAVQEGLRETIRFVPAGGVVAGVGATGSGRELAGVIAGADVVKNEITSHAVAALWAVPGTRTVLEIGGQDSKVIVLRNGVVTDFGMNTICAAGTGSFLDQQAARLGIPIEDFGGIALESTSPVRIAGRCAVFAESDMIHKQQMGHKIPDILFGLCQALVRNYLNNVAKGKDIKPPVVFQGGVAANAGIKRAFEDALGVEVIIPRYYSVMGAIGAAIIARESATAAGTRFRGFEAAGIPFNGSSFECPHCPNRCEIVEISMSGRVVSRWGGKCPRWDVSSAPAGPTPRAAD